MAVFDSRSFDSGTFDSALTYGGTFAAFSVVLRTMPVAGASFTADAVIAPYARLYQLPVEAVILPTDQQARVYQLPVEVVVLPDDQQARLYQLPVEAVVLPTDQQAHLYQLPVEVVRQSYVRRSGSFSAEFELLIGHRIFASFTADAIIKREFEQTFSAKAEAEIVGRMHGNFLPQAIVLRPDNNGSFAAGAVIKKAMPGGLTADAIRKKTQTSTVTQFPAIDTEATVSPWVAGPIYAYYNSAALSISTGSAPVGYGSNSLRITTTALSSDQMAYVPITGTFLAGVQYKLTFWIKKVSGTFTYVRVIFGSQNTNDRTASWAGSGTGPAPSVSWSLQTIYWTPATSRTDAVLALCSYGTAAIGIDVDGVVVTATIPFAFTLNAVRIKTQIKPGFTADAWLKPMFFLADAALLWTANWSFTASAIIQSATPPVVIPPAGKPYVEIWVNGIEYTKHVIWSTVSFTAKVNGAVGEGFLQILDRDHVFDFTFGQEVYLNIDGVIRWGGWILRPQRTYVMPVITNVMLEPRTWVLECIDFNAIFDKRVIYDIARPGKVWEYLPGTYDDTIINDVWNYLDMEGFTKDINRVAPAILDTTGFTAKSIVASGGFTFREIMTAITRTTAAIFYCTPEKVITYVDSDKVNSAYTLTDMPYPMGTPPHTVWDDDFSRVSGPGSGLGPRYTWTDWDSGWASQAKSLTYVDGSVGRMPGGAGGRNYDSYYLTGLVAPTDGYAQMDFLIPPVVAWANNHPYPGLTIPIPTGFNTYVYAYPDSALGSGAWRLSGRNVGDISFTPNAGDWYTLKVGWDASGNSKVKVWNRSLTEPDWQGFSSAPIAGNNGLSGPLIDLYYGPVNDDLVFDNVGIWSNRGESYTPPANSVAYREIRIREDATSMVNDALVWGAGYGNKNLVFSRTQSSPSQTVHGLWQAGEFKNSVYKQATVNAISASWVEGSPSAHRGAKNPKRSVELVTQSTVFSAGDVVVVQNSSFEYTDTLPIRSVITTFPTPFDPRFALTMSWEIDAVWSMYDPWVPYSPKMISPVVVPPEKVTPPKSKPHEAWFVTSGQAGVPFLNATDYFENDFLDFIYYVPNEYGTASNFELFSRTVSSGWGTSTDSHTWTSVYSGNWSTTGIVNGTMSVDGSDGIHRVKPTGTRSVREILSQTNPGGPWTGAHWFRRDRWVPTWNEASLDPRYYSLVVGFVDSRDNRWIWWISINWSNSGAGSFKICERGFGCSDSASVVINQGSTNTITHQHDEEIEGTTDTVCVNGVCITVFRGNPDCNLSTYVVDGFTRANRTGLGPTEDGTLTWTADATSWIESYKAHVHKSTNGTMLPLGLDIAPPIRGTITRPSPPPSSPSSGSVSFIQQPLDFDITVSWTEEWFVTPEMGYWMVTDWSLKVPRGVNETGPYTGPASITTTTCAPNGPMLTNDLYVGGTAIMDPIMNASYNLVTHDVTGLYYNQGVDIYFHNTGYGYNTIYHSDNVHFLFVYDPDTKLWRMAFEDLGGGAGPTPPSGVTPDGFADVYATIDFGDYDVTGIYPIGWGLGYQTIDGEDFEVNYPFEVILDVQPEKITATIDGHSIEATENIGILNPVSDYSLMRNGTELTFDYLFIETCINTAPTDAIGQRACDVLEPQHGLEGDFWPNPMEWKTVTATYIPGSTKLAINGVYQFGYSETDPENGIVTTNTVIGRDDVVTLCYLTNGRLPYVPIVPEGAG